MFVPLISAAPDVIEVELQGEADYSTVVAIAECPNTGRIVTIDCELAFTNNMCSRPSSFWFHEFSFSISVADPEQTTLSFSTQDRTIALNYIPSEIRTLVLPIVLTSLSALVDRVRPRVIYRVSKTVAAIAPALRKHHLITKHLESMAYRIYETGTDPHGRLFWLMATD